MNHILIFITFEVYFSKARMPFMSKYFAQQKCNSPIVDRWCFKGFGGMVEFFVICSANCASGDGGVSGL